MSLRLSMCTYLGKAPWSLRNIPAADFTAPAQSQDHSPPHGSLHLPEGESLLDSDTGQCVQLLSTVM